MRSPHGPHTRNRALVNACPTRSENTLTRSLDPAHDGDTPAPECPVCIQADGQTQTAPAHFTLWDGFLPGPRPRRRPVQRAFLPLSPSRLLRTWPAEVKSDADHIDGSPHPPTDARCCGTTAPCAIQAHSARFTHGHYGQPGMGACQGSAQPYKDRASLFLTQSDSIWPGGRVRSSAIIVISRTPCVITGTHPPPAWHYPMTATAPGWGAPAAARPGSTQTRG